MKQAKPDIDIVQFHEHPHETSPGDSPFAIVVPRPFTMRKYCQALFDQVLQLGLSESAAFLNYQCDLVENPIEWLNKFEKLILINVDHFSTNSLKHRHTKFISQIDIKRFSIEKGENRICIVSEYMNKNQYCFKKVKDTLAGMEVLEEKLIYLDERIFDYRQNPPDYISVKATPFDTQCQVEIERLKKRAKYQQKKIMQSNNSPQPGSRLPFNGDLKSFCDVFYRLMHKHTDDDKRVLPGTLAQITDMICNNFCEADGSPLSAGTVRTYLSPSKAESRPKSDNEI